MKIDNFAEAVAELDKCAEEKFRSFNARIVKNTTYDLIGVRVPKLREIAKSVPKAARKDFLDGFYAEPVHTFESVAVAGLVAAGKGDYAFTKDALGRIIPLFDSWAHTDTVIPTLKWADKDKLLCDFEYLLDRDGQFEVRAYVIMLFDCVTDDRVDFVLDKIKSVRTGEYYVDMALAWLAAECLVKFYDRTIPLIEGKTLDRFVHNKAIQKARESFRVSDEQKAYLNSLKIK